MVDFCDTDFPISTQAEMLSLNRSSLYYKSRPSLEWDLQLNRLIDITYTKQPEFAHRRIAAWFAVCYDFQAERKTVLARMQDMGIQAVYPNQNTSKNQLDNLNLSIFFERGIRQLSRSYQGFRF